MIPECRWDNSTIPIFTQTSNLWSDVVWKQRLNFALCSSFVFNWWCLQHMCKWTRLIWRHGYNSNADKALALRSTSLQKCGQESVHHLADVIEIWAAPLTCDLWPLNLSILYLWEAMWVAYHFVRCDIEGLWHKDVTPFLANMRFSYQNVGFPVNTVS